MQELPNGDRMYPMKGPPPECPAWYVRDKNDPYVLRRVHLPCQYYERKIVKCTKCPAGRMKDYCNFWDGMVNRLVCIDCGSDPKKLRAKADAEISTRDMASG